MNHRVLTLTFLALVSCGAGEANTVEPINQAEALPLQIAFQGLCDARTLAEAGDAQGAADTFLSRSHAELHTIADRLSASDRDAAARLLEAKQRVEVAIDNPATASPEIVAGQISALEAEVAVAAEHLGLNPPVCGGVGP